MKAKYNRKVMNDNEETIRIKIRSLKLHVSTAVLISKCNIKELKKKKIRLK